MKHVPSEKYNIAWFKLSECISRGEKERALGVYKLLSHSIDDAAFVAQLQGDILLAFEDNSAASEKYLEAATLYKKKQRFVEAAAVYEHLVTLQPDVEDHAVGLIMLYHILNFSDKVEQHIERAVTLFTENENAIKLNSFLVKLQEVCPEAHKMAQKVILKK